MIWSSGIPRWRSSFASISKLVDFPQRRTPAKWYKMIRGMLGRVSQLHNRLSDRFITGAELEGICDFMNRDIGMLLDKTVYTANIICGKRAFTTAQRETRFHRTRCIPLFLQSIDGACIYRKALCDFLDWDLTFKGLDNQMPGFVV